MKYGKAALLGAGILSLMLSLSGCRKTGPAEEARLFDTPETVQAEPEPVVIYLTHASDAESFTNQASELFRKILEERSEGRFRVEIFPGNTLGTLTEANASLKNGTTQMRVGPGPGSMELILRYRALTGMDLQELTIALEHEELKKVIDQVCRQYGVRVAGYLPLTCRVLTSNRPISRAEDLQGLVMRVSGLELSRVYWNTLGAETVYYPFSEVYGALQSGMVEANAETTLQDVISARLYDHQKYVSDIQQEIYIEPVYVSLAFYESLTEEEQQLLDSAVTEMVEESRSILAEELEKDREILEDSGVTWIDLTPEEQQNMMNHVREPLREAVRSFAGEALTDRILNTLDRIRGTWEEP